MRWLSLVLAGLACGCVGVSVERKTVPSTAAPPRVVAADDLGHLAGCERFERDEARRAVSCEIAYENDTSRAFVELDIWCRARDARGYQIGARRIHLDAAEVGPMRPGWKLRRGIVIRAAPEEVASVDCELVSGR